MSLIKDIDKMQKHHIETTQLCDSYFQGMYNGMESVKSLVTGEMPIYAEHISKFKKPVEIILKDGRVITDSHSLITTNFERETTILFYVTFVAPFDGYVSIEYRNAVCVNGVGHPCISYQSYSVKKDQLVEIHSNNFLLTIKPT